MDEHRLIIRIVGFASAAHRFAFAVSEGSNLIDWGGHRIWNEKRLVEKIDSVLRRARPLFVACEVSRNARKSELGRLFNNALQTACASHSIMILCVERRRIEHNGRTTEATNYDLVMMAANRFEALGHKIPRKRRLWDSRDDRTCVFLAAAAAAGGWDHFRKPQQHP